MKKLLYLIAALAVGFIISSCEKMDDPFDSEGFMPISEAGIYDNLLPDSTYSYYEIRRFLAYDTTSYSVITSFGANTYTDPIPPIYTGICDSMSQIAYCENIMTIKDNKVKFWTNMSDVSTFIGAIDTKNEALLLAHFMGFFFKYDDKENGIKENGDSYVIHAFRYVSTCSPVQLDRFSIKIYKNGEIWILGKETESKVDGACM